jgi:hypothetical protein
MSLWTKIRNIGVKALPVAAAFVPGIGPIGSSLLGAGIGAATGGGIKGALSGAAMGGLGGLLRGGGGIGNILGNAGKTLTGTLTGLGKGVLGGTGAGTATTASGGLGGLVGGGGLSPLLNLGTSLYSGIAGNTANEKTERELLAAQEKARLALEPYQNTGLQANNQLSSSLANGTLGGTFDAGDFTADPGYQFRLSEGQKALDRQNAASGGLYSGQAMKAAADYGQGLADQTYNDAFSRWLQNQQQTYNVLSNTATAGQNAATGLGSIYNNIGNIQGGTTMGNQQNVNKTLASILSGGGAFNTGDENGISDAELQAALEEYLNKNRGVA